MQTKMDFVADSPEKAAVHPQLMTNVEDVKRFIYAGNARITLVSTETKNRITYRIKRAPDRDDRPGPVEFFVAIMTGNDNEKDYEYLGNIFRDNRNFRLGRKSRFLPSDWRLNAFEWFYNVLNEANALPRKLEVWHEGYCGMCGRLLTVPESIERGIGPECVKQMGLK